MTETAPSIDPSVWVDKHGDYLYAYALSRVHNQTTAENLVQDALLSALRTVSTDTGIDSEKLWLTGILKQKIIKHLCSAFKNANISEAERDFSSYQVLFTDPDWKDHWLPEHIPTDWHLTPEQAVETPEFCDLIEHCLTELPERISTALTLHEMDGMSCEEICEVFDISRENCFMMLHRARMHLRKCMEYGWFRKPIQKGGPH